MHVNDAEGIELLPGEPQPPPVGATGQQGQQQPDQAQVKRERRLRSLWTIGSVLSILLNFFLCLALLTLANQLFSLKKLIGADLLGGLLVNFINMDTAHIRTTIQVQDEIPVRFDLPINLDTQVTTTQPTIINNATVVELRTGGLVIRNAPADIVLPAGTPLQVHLEMVVPVDATVPFTVDVPVDIALDQTELHKPLAGLQQVLAPYYWMLRPEWPACEDVPLFSRFGSACRLFFWGP